VQETETASEVTNHAEMRFHRLFNAQWQLAIQLIELAILLFVITYCFMDELLTTVCIMHTMTIKIHILIIHQRTQKNVWLCIIPI